MRFDDFYSEGLYFSGAHSGGMERFIDDYGIGPCRALDIGAGEGRNSVYLASRGFDVVAVEPSVVGARVIEERARDAGVSLSVVNADFLDAAAGLGKFSFVVSLTTLEHMNPEDIPGAVEAVKEALEPGGYVYVLAFTVDDPGYRGEEERASECAAFVRHYFEREELLELFEPGMEILGYTEYVKRDDSHGPLHYHGKAKLLARRPGA